MAHRHDVSITSSFLLSTIQFTQTITQHSKPTRIKKTKAVRNPFFDCAFVCISRNVICWSVDSISFVALFFLSSFVCFSLFVKFFVLFVLIYLLFEPTRDGPQPEGGVGNVKKFFSRVGVGVPSNGKLGRIVRF